MDITEDMNKILLIDSQDTRNPYKLRDCIKKHVNSEIHLLNNNIMLNDIWFLMCFDLIILNSVNKEIISLVINNNIPYIIQIGPKDLHLIKYVSKAWGIVTKGNQKELILAINVIEKGGCYISAKFKDLVFDNQEYSNQTLKDHEELEVISLLTEMELKVLLQLIDDKTNQEIADSLYLSKRTVEYYITSCMQKLNVKSRVGLAVKIARCSEVLYIS